MQQVKFGNWVRCLEDNWVAMDHIAEVEIKYQGSETKEEDYYEVELTLKSFDLWLPNKSDRDIAMKHGNFYNQMSDPHLRTVFLGTKEECKMIVNQIIRSSYAPTPTTTTPKLEHSTTRQLQSQPFKRETWSQPLS